MAAPAKDHLGAFRVRRRREMTMATREQFKAMVTAQPFKQFIVRLGSGRSFTVAHPELAACDVPGHGMTVYDDEGMHRIDMLSVEVLEPVVAVQSKSDGNGA